MVGITLRPAAWTDPKEISLSSSSCLASDICLPVLLLDLHISQMYALLFNSSFISRSNHHQHSLYHSPSPFSTVCRDIFQRWKLEHILEVELKICSIINNKDLGNSLVVCTCTVGNMIPGQGIKIPEAACVLVTQLCLTICSPMDCSPLGFSVHGIL